MHLKKLSAVNFKNHSEVNLEFSPEINVFIGNNGQGKTNLLDAIYFLSFCKSFLNPIDKQSIKIDEKFFLINGSFSKEDKSIDISVSVQQGQKKKVKKNKKEYERLAEHIGQFPTVIISPYDTNLIIEGSDTRRKFIDSIISQYDRMYLDTLIRYNKVLQQRNALLKQFQELRIFENESIEVWNAQLVSLGDVIYQKRNAFLNDFIPVFQKYFNLVADEAEVISISYESHLTEGNFEAQLEEYKRKDTALGYTSRGIHKDDLVFLIHGHPVKKFGSQGQQKSFLIALKLAQFELISELLKMKPILLLDDIFDKLDHNRVERLMTLVSDHAFGQVFVTDTDEDRVEKVFQKIDIERIVFKVGGDQVVKI
ncbi:DNA replication/repair protein RecF [Paracrocinitomix mangrovi]|uniref:DNA replication/repair protein RecF n=1 Tax=Paracrocinitomix mangrovi TaxID=2862509 RepID=UPI001C8E2399|nr:DNA replication/repair protein RecF [Paracrocinitomix mangrovi]UKN02879.1 DNA replication/repair protein RecF [Paracrocinitomix mangrovi]